MRQQLTKHNLNIKSLFYTDYCSNMFATLLLLEQQMGLPGILQAQYRVSITNVLYINKKRPSKLFNKTQDQHTHQTHTHENM